ncbi:MAG: nuclear transport factor 2 family protein [Propylenella sp.]
MSAESENVEILKNAYAEWGDKKAADLGCWTCLMADDIKMRSLASGARGAEFTQARSGKAQAIAYLEELTRDWKMNSYVVDEYIAQGDRVVAVGSTSWTNKKTGKTASTPKVDIWRMRNGQAVEFAEFYDTAALFAAAQP